MNEPYISHFGVKGMRWGVRKKTSSDDYSSEHKQVGETKKKDPKTLTNKEMRDTITRIKLEQEYKQALALETGPAKKMVRDTLAAAGKESLKNFAAAQMTSVIKTAMTILLAQFAKTAVSKTLGSKLDKLKTG